MYAGKHQSVGRCIANGSVHIRAAERAEKLLVNDRFPGSRYQYVRCLVARRLRLTTPLSRRFPMGHTVIGIAGRGCPNVDDRQI